MIVDPDDSVLLVRFDWEGLELPDGLWACPGGGIEPGETRLVALQRELREETGLHIDSLGPQVWTKRTVLPMGSWDGQIDHIHLVRTPNFDPQPHLTAEGLAAENIHGLRWWSPAELAAGGNVFSPRALPALLERLLREGLPQSPVELDGF